MIIGLHHAQVTVPKGTDLVREFYGRLLGLTEIAVPETMKNYGLIWFGLGDRELHVGQEDGIERTKTMAHLAFEVDDMQAWRQRLAGHAIELFEQPRIAGYDRVHIRDPFGNRIEIIGRDTPGGC